jgi:hypothetical protein
MFGTNAHLLDWNKRFEEVHEMMRCSEGVRERISASEAMNQLEQDFLFIAKVPIKV